MGWLRRCTKRVTNLFGNADEELNDEFHFHLEQAIERNRLRGMNEGEARRAALLAFGGVDAAGEECRDARPLRLLHDLGRDTRYALRQLRRDPIFAVVAVLTLALGIGANTAIFTLVDALLLKSLPVERPRELVILGYGINGEPSYSFSTYEYQSLRERGAVFSGVSAFRPWRGFRVRAGNDWQVASGQLVAGNYFAVLGVHAAIGRTLSEDDDRVPGGHPVAMISYRYWQTQFAGTPDVVGKPVEVQGRLFTIVGVTPPDFLGTDPSLPTDITVPLMMQPAILPGTPLLTERDASWLRVVARLQPGVTLAKARADLDVAWAGIRASESPNRRQILGPIVAVPGAGGLDTLRRRFSAPLRVLMAVVVLILLVACSNLAHMLLARGLARQKEIAIRLSIGASRSRVVRQLLTESILLATLGGAAGVWLARWANAALLVLMSRGGDALEIDLKASTGTLLFTLAVSAGAVLLFGLLPAFRAARIDPQPILKTGNPIGIRGHGRLRKLIVAGQVALSIVLLVGAGLFMRTLQRLYSMDLGFQKEHVLLISIRPAISGYEGLHANQIYAELYRRFNALPGVRSASMSMDVPMGGLSWSQGVSAAGQSQAGVQASTNHAGPRFFETTGTPLLAGRDFLEQDDGKHPAVAIISESLARHFFPGGDTIGRILFTGGSRVQVVGVAKDARYADLRERTPMMMYRPYQQVENCCEEMTFSLRTAGDPYALTAAVRREVAATAPHLPIYAINTLSDVFDATLVRERMLATLSTFFGVLALFLAAVGLYGTLSHSVARRAGEIGLRMAVGATRQRIAAMIFRDSLAPVLLGAAAGIPAAAAAGRFVRGLLFGVTAGDVSIYAGALAVLLTVGTVAAYLPARRAARTDPMCALRCE